MSTNESPPVDGVKGLRILVVDDHDDFALLLRAFMVANGAFVQVAKNGAAALGMAARDTYDLILVDIQMPVMDGYELTRNLRAIGVHVPIIAVTAHAMRHHIEMALAAGCDEVFTKPFSLPSLRAAIFKLCHQHESHYPSGPY